MLVGKIQRGLRPSVEGLNLPFNIKDEYLLLMMQCWDAVPDERPTFKEALARLISMLHTLQGKDVEEEKRKLKLASIKLEKGVSLLQSRNFKESKLLLLESFDLDPIGDTFKQLWVAMMSNGDVDEALEVCNRYIGSKPNSVLGYEKKADCLMYFFLIF